MDNTGTSNVIRLRPHHLLCTQGYEGKGYDPAFVRDMDLIVEYLRTVQDAEIELVFCTDDLCRACPNRHDENICRSDNKVLQYDRSVISLFDLKEKKYRYQDLIRQIDAGMTETVLESICGDCEWYSESACRKNILRLS